MSRSSLFLVMTIIGLSVGWGAWSYFGAKLEIDDTNSISDVDGFESAPVLGTPASPDGEIVLGAGRPMLEPPRGENPVPLPDDFAINEIATTADVWLTGTIEEEETKDRIELPTRVSGGPNDLSVVR